MSLESFYGGRQGISPVIKASFKYIDTNDPAYKAAIASGKTATELLPLTMDECFQQNSYEKVWYGELCIIDTDNKSNLNNGKLFRRTLVGAGGENAGASKSAEYLGRIVGATGLDPFISFNSIDDVKNVLLNTRLLENQTVAFPTNAGESWEWSYTKPESSNDLKIFDGTIVTDEGGTITSEGILVPGAKVSNPDINNNNNFNDTIQYTWVNILDDSTNDNEKRSVAYLGFKVPYPSIKIINQPVDWNNDSSITKQTTGNYAKHPFYHEWNLKTPRGIRGNAASNFCIMTFSNFSNLLGNNTTEFLYDFAKSITEVSINEGVETHISVPTFDNSLTANDIYLYTPDELLFLYNFNFSEATESIFDSNVIYYEKNNDIYIKTEDITKDSTKTYYKLNSAQKINNANDYLNTRILVYKYTFYDKTSQDNGTIKTCWFYAGAYKDLRMIQLLDDGTLSFIYSNPNDNYILNGPDDPKIRWIDQIIVDAETNTTQNTVAGRMTIKYNTKDQFNNNEIKQIQLPYVKTFTQTGTGNIYITVDEPGDSDTTVTRNIYLKDSNNQNVEFNFIKQVNIDPDTKVLKTQSYPNGNETILNNSEGINYIRATTVDERYHLLVFHASTQKRPSAAEVSAGIKDNRVITISKQDQGITWVTWNGQTFRNGYVYSSMNITADDYWQDLGTMRDVAFGIRVKSQVYYDYFDQTRIDTINELSMSEFINTILNPEYWTFNENVDSLEDDDFAWIDNFTDNDRIISTDGEVVTIKIRNPYYGGNIGHYQLNNDNPPVYELIETTAYDNSLRGTFIYAAEIESGSLYFFDYDKQQWAYAGSFSEGTSTDTKIMLNSTNQVINGSKWLNNLTCPVYGIIFVQKNTITNTTNPLPTFWESE